MFKHVGPPLWQPSLPETMIKSVHWKTTSKFISDSNLDISIINIDNGMKKRVLPKNLTYVSVVNGLCEKLPNQKYTCRVKPENSNNLIQVDYGHLSKEGSLFVVNNIISYVLLHIYQHE